ncbi:MAG: universal stress protein [Alphaproteobacteria bacterium]
MMPRTIMVPLTGSAASEAALGTAFDLAGHWSGHVLALCVKPDPRDAAYLVTDTVSGRVVEEVLRAVERESEQRAAAARALFDRVLADAGRAAGRSKPSAALEDVVGQDTDFIPAFGRTADLIVVPRPAKATAPADDSALEAALFSSGRPVLVPPAERAAALAERAVVLWNDTVEGARAVAGAAPFLVRAGRVDIAVADEGRDGAASAARLVANLMRHGIAAESTTIELGVKSAGEVLHGFVAERGATLVVMGAYGHSRLREFVLGGVTRHMLATPGPALLMAH